jgi:hypothetical protein
MEYLVNFNLTFLYRIESSVANTLENMDKIRDNLFIIFMSDEKLDNNSNVSYLLEYLD